MQYFRTPVSWQNCPRPFREGTKQQVPPLGLKPSVGMTKRKGMADAALKRRSTQVAMQGTPLAIGVPRLRRLKQPPPLRMTVVGRTAPLGITAIKVELAFRPALAWLPSLLPICRRSARSPQGRSAATIVAQDGSPGKRRPLKSGVPSGTAQSMRTLASIAGYLPPKCYESTVTLPVPS